MIQMPRFTRRARWAVPSGAVAAAGVVVAGSVLTGAQAAPALPARTPAQLIAAIAANKSVPASLSGTIVSNAALGLPDLPGAGDPTSLASLLTGSHTINFWYARPGQLRIALPVPLGETDLRVDGRQVWLWDSKTNTATHIVGPAGPGPGLGAPPPGPVSSPGTGHTSTTSDSSGVAYQSAEVISAPTPLQAARQLLAAVGPTTAVSVQSNVMVAGRAAYQLALAPKNRESLIGRVAVAIDASRYIPLRVQVFARGASSPAYQVGFTSISFARPAASNFAFTPPPGAKVKTIRPSVGLPPGAMLGGGGGGFIPVPRRVFMRRGLAVGPGGTPNDSITIKPLRGVRLHRCMTWVTAVPTGSLTMSPLRGAMMGMPNNFPKGVLRHHLSKSQRQHLLKMLRRDIARARRLHPGAGLHVNLGTGWHGAGWYGYGPMTGGMFPPGVANAPRVIGTGWMSVGVFPAAGLTGSAGGAAGALLRSATTLVHGSWGSGHLLRTSLLSVLITNNGKALIGAVTPSVLYAAAAQAK
jgi:outer membrane lipoprotein-sorting protein